MMLDTPLLNKLNLVFFVKNIF